MEPGGPRAIVDESGKCRGSSSVEEGGHLLTTLNMLWRAGQNGGFVSCDDRVRGEQAQQAREVAFAGGCEKRIDNLPIGEWVI